MPQGWCRSQHDSLGPTLPGSLPRGHPAPCCLVAGPALSSHWRPQSTATSSLEPSQVQLRGGTDSFLFTARQCRSGAGKVLPPRPALAGLRMVFTFLKGCLKKKTKKRLCDRDPCMVCTVSTIYHLTLYRKSLHAPVWISVSLYPLKKFAHPPYFFSDTWVCHLFT